MKNMTKLTINQKLVSTAIISSLLADFMTDLVDQREINLKALDKYLPTNLKTCSKKLLKFDEWAIGNAPLEAVIQQVDNQNALRELLINYFSGIEE